MRRRPPRITRTDTHFPSTSLFRFGEISELRANEAVGLPSFLDYRAIAGLSLEMMERLEAARPENLAAAGRIRGITPAALAAILVHARRRARSEEHTSELQSLMRISYAVFCLKKKKTTKQNTT